MTRSIILILIISGLATISCSSRKHKLDRRNLIPEDELVSVLTDTYLTDGLLSIPKIQRTIHALDSVSTYYHVIEKHGYSKEVMDKTLKYYFIKNPKKLIKIYDKVLGILSEMESRIKKNIAMTAEHTRNLWPGLPFYSFPDPSASDSTKFGITIREKGIYELTFTVILSPDDQSANPGITAYSCHPDSIETGKRAYINPLHYVKDGLPHSYSILFTVPEAKSLYIGGCLYDFENNPGDWEKHIIIRNISAARFTIKL